MITDIFILEIDKWNTYNIKYLKQKQTNIHKPKLANQYSQIQQQINIYKQYLHNEENETKHQNKWEGKYTYVCWATTFQNGAKKDPIQHTLLLS